MDYDVIVVGAGGAGAPLAARLSEDRRCRVLLVEAGRVPRSLADFPAELLDVTRSTSGLPGDLVWKFNSRVAPGRNHSVTRGRVLGGSTSINGGYFIRPRAADSERWAAAGNYAWAPDQMLARLKRLERDSTYGASELHGDSGPMPVHRELDQPSDFTMAFYDAARELGHPEDMDKNDPSSYDGYGPLPLNTEGVIRYNTGVAYLLPILDERPNLTVRGNTVVHRVVIDNCRATGVTLESEGHTQDVHGGEVVLCAGATKTPHLLMLSGVGPAGELERAGIPVGADSPVGKEFTDHPEVLVDFAVERPGRIVNRFEGILHWTAEESTTPGDLEILPLLQSIRLDGALSLVVTLQQPVSRGDLTLVAADPHISPRIDYRHLSESHDLARMREGIRVAAEVMRSHALRDHGASLIDLDDATTATAREFSRWAVAHLYTAVHMCGTAKMGPGGVVDPFGRVHGIDNLRVADTSILPDAPSRGPAASAVVVGEMIADFMTAP